jgi:Holliday junction DNA helicase RuvA
VISSVSGKILELGLDNAVIGVGGIGLKVAMTPRHAMTLRRQQEVFLHTKLIVREDDLSLFGFESTNQRELFDLLCSVNGIGPKLAMTVLAGLSEDKLRSAVNNNDEAVFRSVSGIGPKTAKLILISLAGKVGLSSISPVNDRVLQALLQLGTDDSKAREALAQVPEGLGESQLLKQALVILGAGKLVGSE